jgi:hypothetical protein
MADDMIDVVVDKLLYYYDFDIFYLLIYLLNFD